MTPSELLIALHNIDCRNDEAILKAVVRGGFLWLRGRHRVIHSCVSSCMEEQTSYCSGYTPLKVDIQLAMITTITFYFGIHSCLSRLCGR